MSSSGPSVDEATDDSAEDSKPAEDAEPARDSEADEDARTPSTALNALLGAVITAATALLVPFSPVLGGTVAGYLEGGETNDGLKVGALSGLVALVPLVFLLLLVLFFVPLFGPPRGAVVFLFFAGVALALVGAYTVGFSALGGALGTYLKAEFD